MTEHADPRTGPTQERDDDPTPDRPAPDGAGPDRTGPDDATRSRVEQVAERLKHVLGSGR